MRCENVFFCARGRERKKHLVNENVLPNCTPFHLGLAVYVCAPLSLCVYACVNGCARACLCFLFCVAPSILLLFFGWYCFLSFIVLLHSVLFVRLIRFLFFCCCSLWRPPFFVRVFVPLWVFCRLLPIQFAGLYSVYTNWRNIEIMFHVSTLLPYEKHDPQKLQRKRHIGNDIVCVVFLEADNTPFSPACIKSHFLHTFILVRPLASPASQIKMTLDLEQVRVSARIRRKPTRYEISLVTRDEVGAFKPYLWEQSVFEKGPMFR